MHINFLHEIVFVRVYRLDAQIETRRDHNQFARDGPQRAARVPKAFQVTEKALSFFRERIVTLAGTSDGAPFSGRLDRCSFRGSGLNLEEIGQRFLG